LNKPEKEACRCEKIRENIDTLFHIITIYLGTFLHIRYPILVSPALTLSPVFTEIVVSRGIKTSRREPNLISPKRSPF